jgi:hypothetical protein
LWLQLLFEAGQNNDNPLQFWTRDRSDHFVALLTLTTFSSASAMTWWGTEQPWDITDDDDEDAEAHPCDDACPYELTKDTTMLVPRTASVSLSRFLSGPPSDGIPCPMRSVPTHTDLVQLLQRHPNLYELFRLAAGGQAIELHTSASFLGTCSHLAAMYQLLQRHPNLPKALLNDTGNWRTLAACVAEIPPITQQIGRALVAGLETIVAAVEFPVYWCGLADEHRFMYSRIDLISYSNGTYAIWEFKTKWGRCATYKQRPLFQDLRQVILYCFLVAEVH